MSVSLKASFDLDGFRNGFRWVPHAAQIMKIELSLKPRAQTGMGSKWVPSGFRWVPHTAQIMEIELSLKPCAKTGMGSEWVPSGFR